MRPGSELITFLRSEMQMSDVYQPAIILELLQASHGSLVLSELPFLLQPYFPGVDQAVLMPRIDRTPRQVLERRKVITVDSDEWRLNFELSTDERREARDLCSRELVKWRWPERNRGWLAVVDEIPESIRDGSEAASLVVSDALAGDAIHEIRSGDRILWFDRATDAVRYQSRVLTSLEVELDDVPWQKQVEGWFPGTEHVSIEEPEDGEWALAFTVDMTHAFESRRPAGIGRLEGWFETDQNILDEWPELGKGAETAPGPRTWWVNQGRTFKIERPGGYIFAPQTDRAGRVRGHHANVMKVGVGDVIIHYAGGEILAIGLVTAEGIESIRPDSIDGEDPDRPGYLARVEYFGLDIPIALTDIPETERVGAEAFDRSGGVKEGYLFPLSDGFSDMLRSHFADRWPIGSPWEPAKRNGLAVYVGKDALENLQHGLEHGVWGWRKPRPEYEAVSPGDLLIFGVESTGKGPRTPTEEFAKHGIKRIVECEIVGKMYKGDRPEWPDEVRSGEVDYTYRIRFRNPHELGGMSVQDLNAYYGDDVGKALHSSGNGGGRGVPVTVSGIGTVPPVDISHVTLADVCSAAADAIRASGLDYGARHDDLVRSFVVSLATKRLVLLTGLSGSGKSRLGIAFGEWLGEDHYEIVPVRPDWTGPDAILGYENLLSEQMDGSHAWVVSETLEFILRAAEDDGHPYLLLLDEMNLAHVERYFADVLSGIESDKEVIPHVARVNGDWRQVSKEKLRFPENLFIVGTVNIDETTYMFSPKVLDRANTLEFRVRTEDLNPIAGLLKDVAPGDPGLVARFLADAKSSAKSHHPNRAELTNSLIELHGLLSVMGREFGHRVFHEALRFGALIERAGEVDWLTALDLQVMQKVLPRIHGSVKQVNGPLTTLGAWCFHGPGAAFSEKFDFTQLPNGEPALPVSFDKTRRMHARAHEFGFVSFAE